MNVHIPDKHSLDVLNVSGFAYEALELRIYAISLLPRECRNLKAQFKNHIGVIGSRIIVGGSCRIELS